jgi:hypothetical protein
MLLVEYERKAGAAYLGRILTKPLNDIFPKLKDCEMDSQKLKKKMPEATDEFIQLTLKESLRNLEEVCKILLENIFAADNTLPNDIRQMCGFIARTIEENNHNPPQIEIEHTAKEKGMGNENSRPALPTKNITEKNSIDELSKQLPAKKYNIVETPITNDSLTSVGFGGSLDLTKIKETKPITRNERTIVKKNPTLHKKAESLQYKTSAALGESILLSHEFLKREYQLDENPSNSSKNKGPSFSVQKNDIKDKKEGELGSEDSFQSNADSQFNLKNCLGTLTMSDKVVGSFIFLRFIVPGI